VADCSYLQAVGQALRVDRFDAIAQLKSCEYAQVCFNHAG
jgi:hypothetical protein